MKISRKWNFRSIAGKAMMGLVLAAMIGSIDVMPALARDGYRYEDQESGYYSDREVRDRRYYRNDGYRRRVYVSPRVIYAPPPPRGLTVFFPPIFIHP